MEWNVNVCPCAFMQICIYVRISMSTCVYVNIYIIIYISKFDFHEDWQVGHCLSRASSISSR